MKRIEELDDIEVREMLACGEAFVTTLADVRMVRDRAVAAERERCTKIAEELCIAAFGLTPQVIQLLRQHVSRIAAKIRSGVVE